MLKIKKKVLFSIIARDDEDSLRDCVNSILAQNGISPYISVSCLGSKDTSFPIAKSFCKKPKSYEPAIVVSDTFLVTKTPDEKSAISNAIAFGNDSGCEYFFFMYNPGELNPDYINRAIDLLNDDVIAVYSNINDSGIQIYTSTVGNSLSIGSFFLTKKSIANRFNAGCVADFVNSIVNLGVFYHIPETLVTSKWIDYILKHEKDTSKQERQ